MNDLLTISQEFLTAGKNNDHSSFTTKLSELGQSIRNVFAGSNNKISTSYDRYSVSTLTYIRSYVSESQEYETYMAVRDRGIYVPPGFKGNLSNYTATLLEAVNVLVNLEKTYIDPIERHLSIILADPSKFKKSITSDCSDVSGKTFDSIYKSIGGYFDGTLRTDQSSLGQAYGRLKDIDDTIDNLIKINTKVDSSTLTPAKMKSRAQLISSLIDKIIIRMKQKPEQFELNGINSKLVGELTHTLARAFEFYATITNSVDITLRSVVDSFYDNY